MKLTRDAGSVLGSLQTLPNGSVVAKKTLSIMFPTRFRDIKLAVVGKNSFVYGLFAIIVGDKYALLNISTYVSLGAAKVSVETVEDVEYFVFTYDPGQVVMPTTTVVARSNLIFLAIDEFVFKGKVPWYVDYEDMGKLFRTAKKFSGSKALFLAEVVEFFAAYIARSKQDRSVFLRNAVKKPGDFNRNNLAWVPLRSVYWSSPGTVNKLAGAYAEDGVVAALVNPSQRVESVEGVLRA